MTAVFHRSGSLLLTQQLFQGLGRVVEGGFIALEAERAHNALLPFPLQSFQAHKVGKVRLQGQKLSALGGILFKKDRHIADALSGRDHPAIGQGVLNMHIVYIIAKHFPALQGVLAALDKVGGVKHSGKAGDVPVQVQAAGSNIAIDALLVLVAGGDAMGLCQYHEVLHAPQHRIPAGGGVHPRGDVEAEEPDLVRPEGAGQVQSMLILVQMGLIVPIHRDLTDGRAQALYGKAVIRQLSGDLPGLGEGQVGNIFTVYVPDLQVAEAVPLQSVDLTGKLGTTFVRKGRKLELHTVSS